MTISLSCRPWTDILEVRGAEADPDADHLDMVIVKTTDRVSHEFECAAWTLLKSPLQKYMLQMKKTGPENSRQFKFSYMELEAQSLQLMEGLDEDNEAEAEAEAEADDE